MVSLLLAIVSSAMISVIMRISSDKVTGNLSMLAVNYLVCLSLGAGYAGFALVTPGAPGFGMSLGLGALNGVLFLSSFMLFQWSTRKNGIVLSSIFMKLGLLVPIGVSVLLFRELPTGPQLAGSCVTVGAIVLINLQKDTQAPAQMAGLIALLIISGSANAMSKVYEVLGSPGLSDQFLFYTFFMAFLLCLGLVIWKKERPGLKELLYGVLIGIPNFFSSKFLLGALGQLPAMVVYPTFSVATILAVTLAGVLAFKERLNTPRWIALGAILAALVMLNI